MKPNRPDMNEVIGGVLRGIMVEKPFGIVRGYDIFVTDRGFVVSHGGECTEGGTSDRHTCWQRLSENLLWGLEGCPEQQVQIPDRIWREISQHRQDIGSIPFWTRGGVNQLNNPR